MAVPSKGRVCGSSLVGILGSNPARAWLSSFDCSVFCQKSLRWADHSSREVLSNVVCLSLISKSQRRGSQGPLGLSRHGKNIYVNIFGIGKTQG